MWFFYVHHVESIAHFPANQRDIHWFFSFKSLKLGSVDLTTSSSLSHWIGTGKIRFVSPRFMCSRYAACNVLISCALKHGRHSAHSANSHDSAHCWLVHRSALTTIFLSADIICSVSLDLIRKKTIENIPKISWNYCCFSSDFILW